MVVVAEEEEMVGVVVEVLLMLLLSLWDMLYNDFSGNTLVKNNWLPTDGPTDRPTDQRTQRLIEMRGRI